MGFEVDMNIYCNIIWSSIIFLVYFFSLEPICHELGHALVLKKIEGYAAISFYIPIVNKFRINVFGIEIYNVRNIKYRNITYSKNDFMELADSEIVEVANAGTRNTRILAIVFVVMSIVLQLSILSFYMIIMFVIIFHAKYRTQAYNDYNIKKNPQEFKKRIIQYSSDNPLKYENLIKEYTK